MSGILPPDVAYKASRAQSQAIAEYLGEGGSADDTSTEGIPLLHLVLSASRKYGLVIGVRLDAPQAMLPGPRDATDVFFSRAALDAHARPPPAPKSRRVPLHGPPQGHVQTRGQVLGKRPRLPGRLG